MSSEQFSKLSKSSKSTEYGTPKSLFDKLNKIFDFKLDPCANLDYPLGTKRNMTEADNGLTKDWNDNTFINPPFGKNIKDWILKMNRQAMEFDENVFVMLLPARTDTKWFQDLIMGKRCREDSVIYFLKGRLKFVNPVLNGKSEPHIIGSMLWIKNADHWKLEKLMKSIPGILIEDWRTEDK